MSKDIFIMLDLETLGNHINPAIAQISAVAFTLEQGAILNTEFNELVDTTTGVDVGLHVDGDTVNWWKQQSQAAQDLVFGDGDRLSIQQGLVKFTDYVNTFKQQGRNVYLWGNGIRADNVWLLSAYKACNMDDPIAYNEDLDYRTLHYLAKKKSGIDFKAVTEFDGVPHNAIDDCKYQIKCAMKMWDCLKD
jgi:hypothetical protein